MDGFSQAATTASASSAPPSPPLAQTSLTHGALGAGLDGRLADQLDLGVGVGGERLTATTTGTPNIRAFSMCWIRLGRPFCSSSRFSSL